MKAAPFGCGYWGSVVAKNLHENQNLASVFDTNMARATALLREFGVPVCSVEDRTDKERLCTSGLACRSFAERHYYRNPRVSARSTGLSSNANIGMILVFQHICAWASAHIVGADLA